MLADPTFDGLEELRTTLADLKAKRDAIEARLKSANEPTTPAITEAELRVWAQERFAKLDDLATRAVPDLQDRQLVETFVDRIEINPEAKTGIVDLMADLESALLRSSTRLPGGLSGKNLLAAIDRIHCRRLEGLLGTDRFHRRRIP